MNTDFLKELGLEQEAIDKVMAENGKDVNAVTTKLETANKSLSEAKIQVTDLNKQIKDLEGSSEELTALKDKVTELEIAETKRLEGEKAEKENTALFATFEAATKEKAFVNDFTKNAIFENCKAELAKSENKGKGINDVFTALTADKEGIFANPNPPGNIPGVGKVDSSITKEQFNKMGYMSRVTMKNENPALYTQLSTMEE